MTASQSESMRGVGLVEALGRFNHHPEPAIDFCIEVEELEAVAENARLGLTGFGHEQERETLDSRIERALDFQVGGDGICVRAKAALRTLATARGFDLNTEVGYFGQPVPRAALSSARTNEQGV